MHEVSQLEMAKQDFLRESVRSALEEKLRKRDRLRRLLAEPEVAVDGQRLSEINRELQPLERVVGPFERFLDLENQLAESRELTGDGDPEVRELAAQEVAALEGKLAEQGRVVMENLVVGEEEAATARVIIEIRAGTGGDEAALFARDLFRMYSRYCELAGFKLEVLSDSASERGGLREVVFSVAGEGCWHLLQFESGGHRVQRVPETETQGRIHTSAATVAVLPEPEEVDVRIDPGELRIDTMRASGPGGQHVNKTSSAIRITHLPTNLVVVCQDEKSQSRNRTRAMRVLRARLYERERRARQEERAEMRRSQIGSGDRNQRVRTYNYPQNRVTDHRLKKNYSLEHVIDGRIEPVLSDLVQREKEERIKAL